MGRSKYNKFASWTWNLKTTLIIWFHCSVVSGWGNLTENWSTPAKVSDRRTSQHFLYSGRQCQHLPLWPSFFSANQWPLPSSSCFILSLYRLLSSKPTFDGVRTIYFKDNFMPDQVWQLENRRMKSKILRNDSKFCGSFSNYSRKNRCGLHCQPEVWLRSQIFLIFQLII